MVSLRKMTDDEFVVFLDDDIAVYAAEKVRAGNWSPEESIEKSREAHARLLPQGLHSPHQHLFTIDADGEAVGRLWLSTDPQTGAGNGFIYDLFVEERFRRQGVAFEAMPLLEQEARRLGPRTWPCMSSRSTPKPESLSQIGLSGHQPEHGEVHRRKGLELNYVAPLAGNRAAVSALRQRIVSPLGR
jgi:GNAT superfamily N-acetyltransferase